MAQQYDSNLVGNCMCWVNEGVIQVILVLLAFNDSKNSYDHQEQVLFSGPFPVLFTDRPESVSPGPIGFGPWIPDA